MALQPVELELEPTPRMVNLAYVVATIGGLLVWVPAVRLYFVARRIKSLRLVLYFGVAMILVIAISGVAIGIHRLGMIGVPVAVGVTGYVALFCSCVAWMNAMMMQVAADRLDARFEANPELEARFRQNWFLKRIMRNK